MAGNPGADHSPWERPADGPAPTGSSAVLTHEHREVDEALERFLADLERDRLRPEGVLRAIGSLRRHIYSEEEFLFPPLARGGLTMPIAVMVREHGALWRLMDTLTDVLTGPDTPGAREHAGALCRDLLEQLDSHNLKEERIIYTSAETVLTAEEQSELATSLEAETAPDGWVCQDVAARP